MASAVGGALSARARRLEAPAIRGLAALALLLCCLLPLLGVGVELLSVTGLSAVSSTLGQASAWLLLLRSVALALAVTALALLVGVPMGVLLARSDVAARRWALWLHLFPVFLPPFLLALGWFHLLGRQGLVGAAWTSAAFFGPAGVSWVLTFAFAPVVSALTVLGLSGIDPSLEEAARVASRPRRVVAHVLLPLAWRSIALGALVVFALTLSEIGVPMFLGVRTYPAAVFTRLAGIAYAPGEAAALVLPLLLIGLLIVAVDRRFVGRRALPVLGLRPRNAAPLSLGPARPWLSLAVWTVVILSLLPLAALAWRAGGAGLVDAAAWVRSSLTTSLWSAAAAAVAIVLIGIPLGHGLARARPVGMALDALSLLSFMVPASVLGAGLIAVYNRPATDVVYSTSAILVLGFAARYAVLGLRTLDAVFSQSSPHYEEAAACAGSGYARRLWHILVPMHGRGVAVAWLLALVFCLRDLDTVVVFYPPGLEPLVVRIFTLEANGPEHVVAALALYQVALTAALLWAGERLLSARRLAA